MSKNAKFGGALRSHGAADSDENFSELGFWSHIDIPHAGDTWIGFKPHEFTIPKHAC